jgi:hypothetical protein
MPNAPLKTFRAVEPANWGFGSTATLASQPFVLAHNYVTYTSNATTGTVTPTASTGTTATGAGWESQAPGNMTVNANRCLPWLARDLDGIYPVAVPNAYDRVYIFPMYTIQGAAASIALASTTIAPYIIPFGLAPDTRGYTDVNKLNPLIARFPEDLIGALTPPTGGAGHGVNFRTNGAWVPLPPYASNFVSANSTVDNSYTNSSPASFARDVAGKFGAGFQLPDDVTISTSTTAVMNATAVQHAASPVIVGAGIEYSTMGSQEIVAVPMTHPSTLTWNATNATQFRVHWFLMGMFLG